jgi:hypothetical protein
MTVFTRRTVLRGAAATTAVGAVVSVNATLPAEAADAATSMKLFVGLSSALTGIGEKKLAPDRDPLNVKQAYYDQARTYPEFDRLLRIYADNQSTSNKDEIAKIILDQSDIRYLARSVILAWYLGAWYEPSVLKNPPAPPIPFKVISSTAYTQGWIWRVAQAHPMGYSEWAFGYWQDDPIASLDTFIQ